MPCRFSTVLLIVTLAAPLGASPVPARNSDAAAVAAPQAAVAPMPGDAFGTEVMLPQRTIIYRNGQSSWETMFDSLVDAFKLLDAYLAKAGIKPDGPAMTIYTETSDDGFKFLAARPVSRTPANPPPGDFAVGEAPSGKALLFVHRGTYDAMDATYEAVTNYLDDKEIVARNEFIEEYVSGLASGPSDMVINVIVPVK